MKKKKLGEELLSKQGKPYDVSLSARAKEVSAFCD